MDSDAQRMPGEKCSDKEYLREEQYRDSSNLNARIRLHAQFSTNKEGWPAWVFRQMEMPEDARILEIGCGPGTLWAHNRDKIRPGWRAVLADLSPGMVSEAAENLGDIPSFSFVVSNAEALPFVSGSFSVVIANHMLYHVANREAAFSEIRRVLVPGGHLFASTVGEAHMRELGDLVSRVGTAGIQNETLGFTLENGAAQLGRVFGNVSMVPYEDELLITEVEPLISYIVSGYDAPNEKLEELSRIIADEINEQGMVRITKSSGLFKAGSVEGP